MEPLEVTSLQDNEDNDDGVDDDLHAAAIRNWPFFLKK